MANVKLKIELEEETRDLLRIVCEIHTAKSGWFDWSDLDDRLGRWGSGRWEGTPHGVEERDFQREKAFNNLEILINKGILERADNATCTVYRVSDGVLL